MSACVDDKYDLDDIDTTTAIKINDLTIPVNVSTITLDNVLDIEDDGLIGIYTNAQGQKYYAIKQEGSFHADPVKIKELELKDYVTVPSLTLPIGSGTIQDATVQFSYLINNVDKSLEYLSYFGLNPNNRMEINLTVTPAVEMSNVQIQLPTNYVASYNGETITGGIIPVDIIDGKMQYPIYIESMLFDPVLKPTILEQTEEHRLDITDYIGLKSATISNASGDVTFSFTMSNFSVNVVSGAIDYLVELPVINPVELNDLPDFLTEGETTLILENPQLYLDFSSLFGANYNTGLSISPIGVDTEVIKIPDLTFQQSIVLAPNTDDLGLSLSLDNTVKENVPDLKNILKGKGLPESIQIDMYETSLDGEIHNMVLGTEEGIDVSGSYTFFTPLSFSNGTEILYQKKETDFFGDDVKNVLVRHFRIQSDVISEIPTDVTLEVYPLDKNGNRIKGKNGEIKGFTTVAQGSSKLDLEIAEEFSGLDGVEYAVKADNMNGVSLSPEQTITLNNIRATISGEYVTKL